MRPQPATLNWNFDAGLTTFEFLADGETLTLNYDVTVTDGVETDLTTVAINITGTNDAPTITGGPVNRTLQETGLDQTDVQITDTGTFTVEDLIPPTSSTPTAPSPAPLLRSGHLR